MNANLMTKKIEMSKKEAKAAGKIGTPEFEELRFLYLSFGVCIYHDQKGSKLGKTFKTS